MVKFWYRYSWSRLDDNCNNFGDRLAFPLAPPSGQILYFSNTLVYDQIPAKPVTFPLSAAVIHVHR